MRSPISHKTLGENLSDRQILTALERMGIKATISDSVITVVPPEYRNDFLHAADIVEDVMIGHGLSPVRSGPSK